MSEFRMSDRPTAPQEVTFEFERELVEDAHPDLSWLEPDSGRYDDVEDAEERARYEAEDARRLETYGDSWCMYGVRAKVRVSVPIGGNSFALYELTSPGLWGVESDSGEEYLNTVYEEERSQLVAALKAMGVAAEGLS